MKIKISLNQLIASTSNDLPSRFAFGEHVFVKLTKNILVPAVIISIVFIDGKVMYTVAVPEDGQLPTEPWHYPNYGCLVNSKLVASPSVDGTNIAEAKIYTRLSNLDSILVISPEEVAAELARMPHPSNLG